jgi:hypothetical protein
MPVEIKMAVLGESHGEGELGIDEVHLHARVQLGMVGRNLENRQLAIVEGKLLDGLGVELDSLTNPDQLISSCEPKGGGLLSITEGSHSDGAQPGVVIISGIGNKESIHLEVVVAQQVEDGVVSTLEGVAEQLSFRQPDGKVGVRAAHVHEVRFTCEQQITK